jgi:hypothetical protein
MKIFPKNGNFPQKLKFPGKMEFFSKNGNFTQKMATFAKNEMFPKNGNFPLFRKEWKFSLKIQNF